MWGWNWTKFIREKGHGHKFRKALRLLDEFPGLPFILIGDSGQEDPAIYADVVKQRPGRVRAIYIRDIDPDADSPLDVAVKKAILETKTSGVPMVLAKDSRTISEHAESIGLIPASALGEVVREVARDRERPEIAAEIIEDAIPSSSPGPPKN